MRNWRLAASCAVACLVSVPTTAQTDAAWTVINPGADGASPFKIPVLTAAEVAATEMPKLDAVPTAADAVDYDKYYYFRKSGIDVAAAYADIVECDGYASGLTSGLAYQDAAYPYAGTLAGAAGAGLGNAFAAAVFGSAEKRRLRRLNMRTCMAYKGYDRFGMSKAQWTAFNFEEGLSSVAPDRRRRCLRQQALVAAKAVPAGKALGA